MELLKNKHTYIKFIFSLLTFLSIFAFTNNHNKDAFSIEVGLSFGKGINCTGRGLCTFTNAERSSSTEYDALGFYIVDETGKATLKIDKNSISYAKAVEQFPDGKFEISENLIMKNNSLQKSPKGQIPVLKKGNYIVIENKDFMIIDFDK
ncbi:MAG: hypothetical protein AB8H03_01155 [Saprospiraceae bacterium]